MGSKSNTLHPKAVKFLKKWIVTNLDNPYASKKVKEQLAVSTGLDVEQINNWLKHTRRTEWFRNMSRERYDLNISNKENIPILVRNLNKRSKKY